jgi:SAM-dependent methyltransferase
MRDISTVMVWSSFTAIAIAIGVTAVACVREQGGVFSEGDAYERFMGRWSTRLAPQLVGWAGVQDGDQVLDVGSGTGTLVTGIDPASAYVAFAQSRQLGDRARFEVGDAQHLAFADGSFDRTLSLLVLNFIPDSARALNEMIRVTRHGGTVAAVVWDYGDGMGHGNAARVLGRGDRTQPRCGVA